MSAGYPQFHEHVFERRLIFRCSCDHKPNTLIVAGWSDSTQPVFDSAGLETPSGCSISAEEGMYQWEAF